jgi:hypothetical protein
MERIPQYAPLVSFVARPGASRSRSIHAVDQCSFSRGTSIWHPIGITFTQDPKTMNTKEEDNSVHAPGPGKPGEVPRPGIKPDPKPDPLPPTTTPQEVPSEPGKAPEPTREHPSDPKPVKPTSRTCGFNNGRNN